MDIEPAKSPSGQIDRNLRLNLRTSSVLFGGSSFEVDDTVRLHVAFANAVLAIQCSVVTSRAAAQPLETLLKGCDRAAEVRSEGTDQGHGGTVPVDNGKMRRFGTGIHGLGGRTAVLPRWPP